MKSKHAFLSEEKLSVHIVQSIVRSKWSVAFLSTIFSFKDKYVLLKVYLASQMNGEFTPKKHKEISERRIFFSVFSSLFTAL